MQFSVGHSDALDGFDALSEVVESLLLAVGDESPLGALVFASPGYGLGPIIERLLERWPGCPIAGCSSGGTFSSAGGYGEDSLSVGLFHSPATEVVASSSAGVGLAESLEGTVSRVVGDAKRKLGTAPKLCFVFADPFAADLASFAEVVAAEVGPDCCVVGGAASDHRVRLDDPSAPEAVGSDGVVVGGLSVLLIGGDVLVGASSGSGWEPVGFSAVATKVDGNVILEIDNAPARDALKRWHMDNVSIPSFPPIMATKGNGAALFRPVFALDEEAGSIVLGGAIPEGSQLELCEVLNKGLLAASSSSAHKAIDDYSGIVPCGAVVVSCAARKWALGTQASAENEETTSALSGTPHLGFYSFGEIVPESGSALFQSHTCTTIVFGAV